MSSAWLRLGSFGDESGHVIIQLRVWQALPACQPSSDSRSAEGNPDEVKAHTPPLGRGPSFTFARRVLRPFLAIFDAREAESPQMISKPRTEEAHAALCISEIV